MSDSLIAVDVVYATAGAQRIVRVDVLPGTTARQAVAAAGLQKFFPELDVSRLALGIYGEVVPDDRVVRPGDRLELYRSLAHDPREQRRQQVDLARKRAADRSNGSRR